MNSLIGIKKNQSQRFLENGKRIPVTLIDVKNNWVIAHKTQDKDHYQAVQIGFDMKRHASKAELGHAKKGAKQDAAPKFLREVRIFDDSPLPEVGTVLNPSEVFAPGDIINVTGVSKGKGYQGGVKRYGFHGGPKTHGQSDRHRAPGSIGSGTTPGRVYRGKRMAGNMGNDRVTVRNLEIIEVTNDGVLIVKGLVPGVLNSLISVKKVGTDTKFVPLWKPADAEAIASEEKIESSIEAAPEEKGEEAKVESSDKEVSEEKGEEAQPLPEVAEGK